MIEEEWVKLNGKTMFKVYTLLIPNKNDKNETEKSGEEYQGQSPLTSGIMTGCVLKMPRPPNPLDALIDQLGGPSCVAEMSGRSQRSFKDSTEVFGWGS